MRRTRVVGAYSPRYRSEDDLGRFLREAVREICERIESKFQSVDFTKAGS